MWRSFDLELVFRWASASNIYTRSLTPHPAPARAQQEMELVDTKTSEVVILFYILQSIPYLSLGKCKMQEALYGLVDF